MAGINSLRKLRNLTCYRYTLVGILATSSFFIGTFLCSTFFAVSDNISLAAGLFLAITVSFLGHQSYTFKTEFNSGILLKYTIVFAFNYFLVFLLSEFLRKNIFDNSLTIYTAISICCIVSFYLNSFIVFPKR